MHWNREELVKAALNNECTHLLFLDTDMSFNDDAINKLIERDKDIIGVHYNTRRFPTSTTVHMDPEKKARLMDDNPEGLVTCDSVGTGFMLIKLSVFDKLTEPWFFWKSNDKGEVVMGEDYWFCEKAREAGFEIWLDVNIPVKHIGDYQY